MFKIGLKNIKRKQTPLEKLILKAGLKPIQLFLPASLLCLSAAILDGFGKGLLIPLVNGIINADFGFLRVSPVLKNIIAIIPQPFISTNTSLFIILVGLILFVTVANNIVSYVAALTITYQVRKFSNNLRKVIFGRYLSFGKLFFDQSSLAYLNNILMDFTNAIANNTIRIQQCFTEIFRLIVYLIILFIIDWKLTFFVISIFPILYFSLGWLIKKIKRTSQDLVVSVNQLSRGAFNVLSNIALVKSYTREEVEQDNFSRISDTRARLEFSIDKKENIIRPLQEFFILSAFIFLLSIIAVIVIKYGNKNIGAFLLYFYLLRNVTNSFNYVNNIRACVASIAGPTKEILKIFDEDEKFFVKEGNREFSGLKDAIEFKHLNFYYVKGAPVLSDINFSLSKGEMTALVGPSGSGKTTIVSLLMSFYEFSRSSIFIDGADIKDFTLKSLRAHMALVSQDTLIFNDTLKNNIAYGLDGCSEEQIIDALKKARLYDFTMQLPQGLDTLLGDKGVRLSGGERQRVSIARALLKGAEILILDEATSSLDTRTEKLIGEAIEEAVKGRTTIVIAHRLSTIKNSDKIIVIENGSIIEEGALNTLLEKKGKFYQYWEEQKFY